MNGLNHKQRGHDKLSRIPVKVVSSKPLPKPEWLRVKLQQPEKIAQLKSQLRASKLTTVCEEASCPNLYECFSKGTATFMIMGDKCTRRCSFCDVAHGRPDPLDPNEPTALADNIAKLKLSYVVITSVDRDDLKDGGASHFVACIEAIRARTPSCQIETLVPDFRGRQQKALVKLIKAPPDVMNHNIETVPRLYTQARPGSDFQASLNFLQSFKQACPEIPTKSGMMLGLGETEDEVIQVLHALRKHNVDRLTLGQYLQPSQHHFPVAKYITPETFAYLKTQAEKMGFSHVASGPLVRSSYHADLQNAGEQVS
jgi:lipoyl synthase